MVKQRPWIVLVVVLLTLWLALAIVFSVVALNAAEATTQRICADTNNSWVARNDLILSFTAPTTLSPEAVKLFPRGQTDSLELQIEQGNAIKALNRTRLLAENGPKPGEHC